jgi:hypothetical protein
VATIFKDVFVIEQYFNLLWRDHHVATIFKAVFVWGVKMTT